MKNLSVLIILLTLSLASCIKDTNQEDLKAIQTILPGQWDIKECHLSRYGLGIYVGGELIKKDTLIKDLGTLYIPEFNVFNLDLNASTKDTINMVFNYKDERIPVQIENLFLSGRGYFAYFRASPEGETEGVKFVNSSFVFRRNAYIFIEDANTIRILDTKSDDKNKDYTILKRK